MIRLTRRRTEFIATDDELRTSRAHYERDCALHLPGFIAGEDLAFLQHQIERDGFHERVHHTLKSRPVDLALNDGVASAVLTLMLNDARVIEFARRVTGLDDIRSFSGVTHRRVPGAGHDDAWHNDLVEGRLAALTLNLGVERFEGGALQIKRFPDGALVYEFTNNQPGDAVLFALSRDLKHRVTSPEVHTRTVYAGWFRSVPVGEIVRRTAIEPPVTSDWRAR
jgi:2OG-Fe(II) oxygenase superfamily